MMTQEEILNQLRKSISVTDACFMAFCQVRVCYGSECSEIQFPNNRELFFSAAAEKIAGLKPNALCVMQAGSNPRTITFVLS